LALAAFIVVVGCSGGSGGGYVPKKVSTLTPASVKAGQEASLFPFKVGNSWTYRTVTAQRIGNRTQERTADVTFKVVNVEDAGGGKRATIDLIVADKPVDRQVWISNSRGIYQVSIGRAKPRVFSTPIPAVLFPVEAGNKFKWSGSEGNTKLAYSSVVVGPQEVDTDEKRMSAIAIESKGSSSNPKVSEKLERTIWFVPGVGIVRIRESATSNVGASELLISLKSHQVK
jgi:hypothetical protein